MNTIRTLSDVIVYIEKHQYYLGVPPDCLYVTQDILDKAKIEFKCYVPVSEFIINRVYGVDVIVKDTL